MEITGLAIAGDIDEIVLIDVNAMLARGPEATVLLAAFRLAENPDRPDRPRTAAIFPLCRTRAPTARACSNR